jgi:hypothetical protein
LKKYVVPTGCVKRGHRDARVSVGERIGGEEVRIIESAKQSNLFDPMPEEGLLVGDW